MGVDSVQEVISSYSVEGITLATLCSHTSLQIFHGAREEGFKTLGLAVGAIPKYYDAYPKAKPDDFLLLGSHLDVLKHAAELRERSAIVIPHGSLVEYLGADNFLNLDVPTFGNRSVLKWESDRQKSRQWLEGAGVSMPFEVSDPRDIKSPVIVKYHGAKGGRGFFIARDYADFAEGIEPGAKYSIQEFVLGTRFYFHYFYSPIARSGYRLSKGALEMLGIDRRLEANVDEIYRAGRIPVEPTFVVTGNIPVVLREKLLEPVFDIGRRVVEKSIELFGGMIGPFCLETMVTDALEFKVFEVSARLVAGTNLYPTGSPYSDYVYDTMSCGRRIAHELRNAARSNQLHEVLS
ncbi:MAG TPA: formate--phosphoribosylaminoimidazolecarboxamide ligase [Candidatus Bathyarchaeia archaeon]|nr:formate--phosphoribosylaminoimidazolecarboxamide ligase [Candidatus Bathyarchaeia archaeon]